MIARVGKGEAEGSEHRLVTMAVSSILALIAIRFADANLTPAWTCAAKSARWMLTDQVLWRDGAMAVGDGRWAVFRSTRYGHSSGDGALFRARLPGSTLISMSPGGPWCVSPLFARRPQPMPLLRIEPSGWVRRC